MGVSLNSNGMNLDYSYNLVEVTERYWDENDNEIVQTFHTYYPPSSCKIGCMFYWDYHKDKYATLPPGGTYDGIHNTYFSGMSFVTTGRAGSSFPYNSSYDANSLWMRRA